MFSPRYWNSLYYGLISPRRMQSFRSWFNLHSISFRSTRYPLMLGGERQCRFKPCRMILYMTSVPGIEPQTSVSPVYEQWLVIILFFVYQLSISNTCLKVWCSCNSLPSLCAESDIMYSSKEDHAEKHNVLKCHIRLHTMTLWVISCACRQLEGRRIYLCKNMTGS